jgi:hypothetical protein
VCNRRGRGQREPLVEQQVTSAQKQGRLQTSCAAAPHLHPPLHVQASLHERERERETGERERGRRPEHLVPLWSIRVIINEPRGGGPRAGQCRIVVMRLKRHPNLAVAACLEFPRTEGIRAILAPVADGVCGGAEGASLTEVDRKPTLRLVIDCTPSSLSPHYRVKALLRLAL